MKTIALYVGSNTHFNVTRDVANAGWMLADEFDLHLVTTAPDAYEPAASAHFTVYGDQFPTTDAGHALSLWTYLNSHSPDVVVPMTRPVLYGSLVTPFAFGTDIDYVYRHSGEIFRYYECLDGVKKAACYGGRNVLGKLPLSAASAYVSLWPGGRDRLVQAGVDPTDVTVLPPAISPDRFDEDAIERPDPLSGVERDVVLFIGRRTRLKGIDVMERVIPEVLRERDDLQFVFLGEGGRVPDVPPSVADHVTVVGGVPPAQVPSYFRHSDALVLPSMTEGVPRVLLEALYMDTPVLATPVGGVPDVTDNTFETVPEFVDLLADYESLPVESADSFERTSLQDRYVDFYERL